MTQSNPNPTAKQLTLVASNYRLLFNKSSEIHVRQCYCTICTGFCYFTATAAI